MTPHSNSALYHLPKIKDFHLVFYCLIIWITNHKIFLDETFSLCKSQDGVSFSGENFAPSVLSLFLILQSLLFRLIIEVLKISQPCFLQPIYSSIMKLTMVESMVCPIRSYLSLIMILSSEIIMNLLERLSLARPWPGGSVTAFLPRIQSNGRDACYSQSWMARHQLEPQKGGNPLK